MDQCDIVSDILERYGLYVVKVPYYNVVNTDIKIFVLKEECVIHLQNCKSTLSVFSYVIGEYVEIVFVDKNEATMFKLIWG